MNVSETVTLVLARGIFTANRELTTTVIIANSKKRKSNFGSGIETAA